MEYNEELAWAITRAMSALNDLDELFGVKVKASLTYDNGAAIVEEWYDSEHVGANA